MNAINDRSRPTASGPLGRQYSLDPMGPRAMLSLGDGNQPPSVGPVGRPWIPEQPGDQVTESDFKRTTQTRSESESDTGATDSVIRTESDAQTDRANISMANGPTDSNVIPSSSDSAVHSLGERLTQTKSVSKSVAGIADPVIQTGCEVQTDRVNISIANGPTDSSVTPPSSDSGVHSLGEQWENMSANSMNTGSIQTVKTFYGGDTSQIDRKSPQENRKVVFGKKDSMVYSTTDSQNSDIAAMSDFSDDENWSQGELQPSILTVSDDSIKKELNSCDESVPDITTAGVGSISLDPNDKEYWTKFRLLTRQAFMLDNDKLSESSYPDAVKELVIRSRLTMMKLNEGEDMPLEQCEEGETSDYSDSESTTSIYSSVCQHREEDYYDWHYDRAPIVPDITANEAIGRLRNAENNGGQCPTSTEGNDDKADLYSEPGGRARSELSPEKAVMDIHIVSVDCFTDDDITVGMRNLAGVSDTNEYVVMRVSMITAEVSQGHINSDSNDSPGIQDCVSAEREKQDDLLAHMDFKQCEIDSLQKMTGNCFGVCGLTHRLNRLEIDWCWECIDRLIWGYRVSCVVTIVTKNRTVGIDVFIEGSCVYASTRGLEDGPVRPCDVIPVYVWMTEQFKDVLRGSPDSGEFGNETGPVARNGQSVLDLDWLDGHPNRRGGSVITRTDATVTQYCSYMGEIPTEDGARRNRPAVWINVFNIRPVFVRCSNDTDTAWTMGCFLSKGWTDFRLCQGLSEQPSI